MALAGAREDPRITRYLDQLVRFEVSSVGFSIEPAELSEAEAFWESRQSTGARLAPRRDLSVRGPQALEDHGFASIPQIGAKAAQLAELQHMFREWLGPLAALPTPERAFALPIVHYVEHFERSGAAELYANSSDALRNPTQRPAALAAIRAAIRAEVIDAELLENLEQRIDNDFGNQRVRFRSSSNTEDLAEFNGAGLYTSTSAELGDPERSISDALHTVWASLWNDRAYDEREYANVAHGEAAMGVLVHPAYLSELANGVAISRDILDPIRADQYYVNVQFGEASVTNPAPGVTSEEFVVRWAWPGHPITYSSRSSLLEGQVLTQAEVDQLIRYLSRIHAHFQPLIDPQGENRWFAMDIEFKLESSTRRLIVKQARPYSFGRVVLPDDCREF
jgi:phosphoenolpyruvate synthase/pyruvate phosphate dikinase